MYNSTREKLNDLKNEKTAFCKYMAEYERKLKELQENEYEEKYNSAVKDLRELIECIMFSNNIEYKEKYEIAYNFDGVTFIFDMKNRKLSLGVLLNSKPTTLDLALFPSFDNIVFAEYYIVKKSGMLEFLKRILNDWDLFFEKFVDYLYKYITHHNYAIANSLNNSFPDDKNLKNEENEDLKNKNKEENELTPKIFTFSNPSEVIDFINSLQEFFYSPENE